MKNITTNTGSTRSEICHLADIAEKGYAGIVLSNETAYGKYPLEVMKFVNDIIKNRQ